MGERKYTTQLQAGLGLIDETRQLLELWEPGTSTPDLTRRALESGHFPGVSARRLRNIVSECFAPRFLVDDGTPARVLKLLEGRVNSDSFRQLLLIYTCRAHLILADFVREVYWSRYVGGQNTISKEDARDFVEAAVRSGKTTTEWSESTVKRVSAYLLGCCADYGLLGGSSRQPREIQAFRVSSPVSAVLAYDLHCSGVADSRLVGHSDWELFGLESSDVGEELKRLSRQSLIILQSAAGFFRIEWQVDSWEDVIDVIAER
jgi:hypothetical protein